MMARYTEWSPELAEALAAPFAPELVKTKRKGGTEISFVSWHRYAERLNELVGPNGWSSHVTDRAEVGGKLMLVVTVTILGASQSQVGTEDEEKDDYGDAPTNAWAQAFKRACANHGLGLYMYFGKEGRRQSVPPSQRVPPHQRKMPMGHNKDVPLGDMSDKDLQSAVAWCEEKGKYPDLVNDIRFVLASRTTPEPGDELPPLPFEG